MNSTLAALLHSHRRNLRIAALLTSSFFLLTSAVAPAAAEVIPIIITNIVVQKIGPEAELEPLEEGLLYWRPADATTEAGLYYADGETPGGVAVCVGKADYHTLTNDLACNGHAIELNAHYSLRAEGDSCLLRYGTNIVLRVDGNREAGSTNSLIKATILSADNEGLTIQANALAADGATIEVTTDLMAVEAWTTATNAAVIESTDVTTTWRITYLDEPYQFYRVFAGASTPHGTGITAERPFTASQGLAIPEGQPLTLGTNTWTEFPTNHATHAELSAHTSRTDNPHGVTAAQTGALPLSGGTVTGAVSVALANFTLDVSDSSFAAGQALSAPTKVGSQIYGRKVAATSSWAWVWSGIYSQNPYYSHGDRTFNINPAGGASGFWIGETNLQGHIDGAVASVETRVEVLEMPEWCTLYWGTNYVCHSGTASTNMYTYLLPTNFPTKKLRVYLDDTYADYIVITTPKNWDPGREVEISVIPVHQYGSTPTNRYTEVRCADGSGWASFYYSRGVTSDTRLLYYPDVGFWESRVYTLQQFPYRFSKSGTRFDNIPQNGPETVEEWLALHPEWADTTPATLLSFSPSLSPSFATAIQPATFAPAAFDPDDFTDDPTALDDLAPDDFADAPDDTPAAEE